MRNRLVTSLSLSVPIAIILWASVPIGAQTSAPSAKSARPAAVNKWTPTSRTPDGQPDLQGFWNFQTLTPLERPKAFANQEFLTDAEAAALEAKAVVDTATTHRPARVIRALTISSGSTTARRSCRASEHR